MLPFEIEEVEDVVSTANTTWYQADRSLNNAAVDQPAAVPAVAATCRISLLNVKTNHGVEPCPASKILNVVDPDINPLFTQKLNVHFFWFPALPNVFVNSALSSSLNLHELSTL